ncbi:MAG: methylenetetrahydrofolate reductase C-terminal domain-containing protein [Bacteroidetes bacterium]|nr:methylenetetrahydrofolate reductase C-terminal domain-containing protein [Bacteroidota bacterium]
MLSHESHHRLGNLSVKAGGSPVLYRSTKPKKRPITPAERRLSRVILFFEDAIKVPLFRCQHCGECILSSTAFICSQNCPKRMRNGPCGGTREDGTCEVYRDRKCVWQRIYYRSKLLHRISLLFTIHAPHDWGLERTSAWLNVLRKRTSAPTLFLRNDEKRIRDIIVDDAAEQN